MPPPPRLPHRAIGRGGRALLTAQLASRKRAQCTKGFSDPDYCNNRCATDEAAHSRASPLPVATATVSQSHLGAPCPANLDSTVWPGRWEVTAENGAVQWAVSRCKLERPSAPAFQRCLRGQRIVLVGDCMLRYQYLSLVHFLETGDWGPRM